MNAWHEAVVAKTFDPERGYRCFHCSDWFPRERVVGDHFPLQKGKYPELKYEVSSGVPSCVPCNGGGSPKRVASVRHWRKTGLVVPVWERSPRSEESADSPPG